MRGSTDRENREGGYRENRGEFGRAHKSQYTRKHPAACGGHLRKGCAAHDGGKTYGRGGHGLICERHGQAAAGDGTPRRAKDARKFLSAPTRGMRAASLLPFKAAPSFTKRLF